MADQKTSDFPQTPSIGLIDLVPIIQGLTNKTFTGSTLREQIGWTRSGGNISPFTASDNVVMNGGDITGLPAVATTATSPLTKGQFDTQYIQGAITKANVRLATTGDISLNGIQSVDGSNTATNDRILVILQTDATENGIYNANDVGAWTRTSDLDNVGSPEIFNGVWTVVESGTLNIGKSFRICSVGTGANGVHTIGVDDIDWDNNFDNTQAGIGLSKNGNILSFDSTSSPVLTGLTLSGLSDGLVRSASGILSGAGTVNLGTEVSGILPIGSVSVISGITSLATGVSNNDTLATGGYVDDNNPFTHDLTSTEFSWDVSETRMSIGTLTGSYLGTLAVVGPEVFSTTGLEVNKMTLRNCFGSQPKDSSIDHILTRWKDYGNNRPSSRLDYVLNEWDDSDSPMRLLLTLRGDNRIGFNTTTPMTSLHIVGEVSPGGNEGTRGGGGVLSQSINNIGDGDTLNLGAGLRLHWYAKKGAFRAGLATGTEWDDAQIGDYSVAFGESTTAKGNNSITLGIDNINESYASAYFGQFPIQPGGESVSSWVGSDTLFVVGNGLSDLARSNALTLLKNGNMTIPSIVSGLVRSTSGVLSGGATVDLTSEVTGDLPIADGGTGASDTTTARSNLGLVIGTDVQAFDSALSQIAGLTLIQGDILYVNGSSEIVKLSPGTSGNFLKTNGVGNDPEWASGGGGNPFDQSLNTTDSATFDGLIVDANGSIIVSQFGNDNPIYSMQTSPSHGYNLYFDSGWKYGAGSSSEYGGVIGFVPSTGSFSFSVTQSVGNEDGIAVLNGLLSLSREGELTSAFPNSRWGLGTSSIDSSAKFQINSTDSGFLPPVMAGFQRDAIGTPVEGLLAQNSSRKTLDVRTDRWVMIRASKSAAKTASITLSNNTTESNLFFDMVGDTMLYANSYGDMYAGGVYKYVLSGTIQANSGVNITIRNRWGTTGLGGWLIHSQTISFPSGVSAGTIFFMELYVTIRNTSDPLSIHTVSKFTYDDSGTVVTSLARTTGTGAGVNPFTDNNQSITFQWSAVGVGNSVTLEGTIIDKVA